MASSLEAFRKHDFDNDETWKAYLSRVEVPDPSPAVMERLKAKYYKREIDPDFDLDSLKPTQQGAPRSSDPVPIPQPQRQPQPQQQHAAPPSTPSDVNGPLSMVDVACVIAEYAMVLAAIVSLIPISPRLSMAAFGLCCQLGLFTNGVKLHRRYGSPPLRPFPAALMPWMSTFTASELFFPLLLSVVLSSNRHLGAGVAALALPALCHADAASYQVFREKPWYGPTLGRLHAIVAPHTAQLQGAAAASEVTLCFMALLAIPQIGIRGAGTAFVLWNQLRLRYHTPAVMYYHRQIWALLDSKVAPLVARFPVLRQFRDASVRWFTRRR